MLVQVSGFAVQSSLLDASLESRGQRHCRLPVQRLATLCGLQLLSELQRRRISEQPEWELQAALWGTAMRLVTSFVGLGGPCDLLVAASASIACRSFMIKAPLCLPAIFCKPMLVFVIARSSSICRTEIGPPNAYEFSRCKVLKGARGSPPREVTEAGSIPPLPYSATPCPLQDFGLVSFLGGQARLYPQLGGGGSLHVV